MRRKHLSRVAGLAAAVALTVAGCGGDSDTEAEDGAASGEACGLAIGFFGALTGDAANLGINIEQGAKLAIDEYNAENADCEVELKEFDSQGSPDQAPGLAQQAISDDSVIGIVGPAFTGESEAAGPLFAEAGLTTITPSATNPGLAENGWDTFHRMLGNDASQGPAAAKYISETLAADQVFVIDDASAYGKGLADIVKEDLGDAVVGEDTVQKGQTDFSATVTAVQASGAPTLFYGGYYTEAGLLRKQLSEAGVTVLFVSADGVKDQGFIDAAGADNAEGSIVTCPCLPPDQAPDFYTAYQAAFDQEPGTYAAEGYDSANVFLAGFADGVADRPGMLDFVNGYEGDGVTKRIKFTENGEVETVSVWAYKVEGGKIVADQEIK